MQGIKTKLLVEYANQESIQNPYAAPLFGFQAEGLYTPVLVAGPASIVTWRSAATDRMEGWKLDDEGACS